MTSESSGAEAVPTSPSVKSPSRRRWIVRAVIAAAALSAILLVVRQTVESSGWRGFCDRQRALAATRAARPGARTPVPENPVPGEAWDDYHEAALVLGIVPRAVRDDFNARLGGSKPPRTAPPLPPEIADPLMADCAAGLDHLRAGARRTIATRSRKGSVFPAHWLGPFALNLLRYSYRRNFLEGRLEEAIDDLATLMQLNLDLGGSAFEFDPEAAWLLSDAALSVEQLGILDRMFERAESQTPSLAAALEDDRATLGLCIGPDGEFKPGSFNITPSKVRWWRAGSVRLEIASADEERSEEPPLAPAIEALPWDGAVLRIRAVDPARRRFRSVFAGWRYVDLRDHAAAVRRTRAHCRLVRAATMVLRGQNAESPDWPRDPFDFKPVRLALTDTEIRVWSPDADGDQGGEPPSNERSRAGLGWDLVLTIGRRAD